MTPQRRLKDRINKQSMDGKYTSVTFYTNLQPVHILADSVKLKSEIST